MPGVDAWHLDHQDSRLGYRGPSHADCNTGARPKRELLADDPAHNVFYGPPDKSGYQSRWSRKWYAWRDDPALNPDLRRTRTRVLPS